MSEGLGRICYAADQQLFAVATAESRLWKDDAHPEAHGQPGSKELPGLVPFGLAAYAALVLQQIAATAWHRSKFTLLLYGKMISISV